MEHEEVWKEREAERLIEKLTMTDKERRTLYYKAYIERLGKELMELIRQSQ